MQNTLNSSNKQFLDNYKSQLVLESEAFLTEDKKNFIKQFGLTKKEKEIEVSLMKLKNWGWISSLVIISLIYDYAKNRKHITLLKFSQNILIRILSFNIFYYMLCVKNERFYSIIYYKHYK
jgi:hypothetical protein